MTKKILLVLALFCISTFLLGSPDSTDFKLCLEGTKGSYSITLLEKDGYTRIDILKNKINRIDINNYFIIKFHDKISVTEQFQYNDSIILRNFLLDTLIKGIASRTNFNLENEFKSNGVGFKFRNSDTNNLEYIKLHDQFNKVAVVKLSFQERNKLNTIRIIAPEQEYEDFLGGVNKMQYPYIYIDIKNQFGVGVIDIKIYRQIEIVKFRNYCFIKGIKYKLKRRYSTRICVELKSLDLLPEE